MNRRAPTERVIQTIYFQHGILVIATEEDGQERNEVCFPSGDTESTRFLSDIVSDLRRLCEERRVWADYSLVVRLRENPVESEGLPPSYGGGKPVVSGMEGTK